LVWTIAVLVSDRNVFGQRVGLESTRQESIPARWHIRHPAKNAAGNYVVAFSPNGKYLATRDRENQIFVFDLDQDRKLFEFQGHDSNWTETISFSPDSQFFVTTAGSGEQLKVWSSTTGTLELEIPTTAYAANFTNSGDEIVVFGSPYVEYYFWPSGKFARRSSWQLNKEEPLAMSSNGRLVAMQRRLNANVFQTELLNLNTQLRQGLSLDASKPRQLSMSQDNRWIAGSFLDSNRLHLWGVADPSQMHYVLDGHHSDILSLAFSSDDRFLVSVDDRQELVVWEVLTRQPVFRFKTDQSMIRSLAFSTQPYVLACCGSTESDSSIWIGDLRSRLLPTGQLPPGSMDLIWQQLGSASAETALASAGLLVEHFEHFSDELQATVYGATFENSIEDLDDLLEQLADSRFQQRELATQELINRLSYFESSLRELLGTDLPIETRYRINQILKKRASRPRVNVEVHRRWQRLLFVLEVVDTPESRRVIKRVATGHPDREISVTASTALARLSLIHRRNLR
jgi:hypothetical protein